jgi:hypothetical protein
LKHVSYNIVCYEEMYNAYIFKNVFFITIESPPCLNFDLIIQPFMLGKLLKLSPHSGFLIC